MDIGSLDGQNGVCVALVERGHWAAECPKRGKAGQGGNSDDGKGQGKKGKAAKGKADDDAKGKSKGASGKHEKYRRELQSLLEMGSHGKGLFHVGENQGKGWQRQKCRQS